MALARADLESLLRSRQLDRTLTTALPPPDPVAAGDDTVAATGITSLDAHLGGGFPRGQVSELIGPRSSGRTSLLLQALAAATSRGELTAVVDVLDMFDVESATAAGVDLTRLLWIRGHMVMNPGMCRDLNQRAIEQTLRAFALVLQAGNFGLVVFDAADAPADAIRRLPFTTWLRLQRMVEGSTTACLLIGAEPMARSAAGLTLRMGIGQTVIGDQGLGIGGGQGSSGPVICDGQKRIAARFTGRLFDGLNAHATVMRARVSRHVEQRVQFATRASYA